MKPQRKCIGCGRSFDKDTLLRIVLSDGEPVLDKIQKLPGRGCYLCKDEKCLEAAMKRKALSKIYKKDISNETLGRCFNDR